MSTAKNVEDRVGDVDRSAGGCSRAAASGVAHRASAPTVTKRRRPPSTPPWLNGLQRTILHAASAPPRITPVRADRLLGVRGAGRRSTCSARGAPARSGGSRARIGSTTTHERAGIAGEGVTGAFHALRRQSTAPGPRRGAPSAPATPGAHRARPGRPRPGERRDEVVVGGARSRPQKASWRLRLTAFRSTAPPTLRLTETPRRTSSPARRRPAERVDHEEAVAERAALAVDAVEVAASRETPALRPGAEPGASRGEPLAALAPARLRSDGRRGAHAGAKPGSWARLRFFGW